MPPISPASLTPARFPHPDDTSIAVLRVIRAASANVVGRYRPPPHPRLSHVAVRDQTPVQTTARCHRAMAAPLGGFGINQDLVRDKPYRHRSAQGHRHPRTPQLSSPAAHSAPCTSAPRSGVSLPCSLACRWGQRRSAHPERSSSAFTVSATAQPHRNFDGPGHRGLFRNRDVALGFFEKDKPDIARTGGSRRAISVAYCVSRRISQQIFGSIEWSCR